MKELFLFTVGAVFGIGLFWLQLSIADAKKDKSQDEMVELLENNYREIERLRTKLSERRSDFVIHFPSGDISVHDDRLDPFEKWIDEHTKEESDD